MANNKKQASAKHVVLAPALHERAKGLAVRKGIFLNALIHDAVQRHVAEQERAEERKKAKA